MPIPPLPLWLTLLLLLVVATLHAQPITTEGQPARLVIRSAGEHSIRITLKPISFGEEDPYSPALVDRPYPAPALDLTQLKEPVRCRIGDLTVEVSPHPLMISINAADGTPLQRLVFHADNTLIFDLHDAPLLGMGEGGHKPAPGVDWRQQPIEFDRRGRLQEMQPRWQSDAYGSRNPVPLMIGTEGWALFIATPWGQIDLRPADHGIFSPWQPTASDTIQQNEKNQSLPLSKGLPARRLGYTRPL